MPKLTLDLGRGVTMKFVLLPAGKFLMGTPSGKAPFFLTVPQHEVTIAKPFFMDVYEVTQAQYQAVMGLNPSRFQGADFPVQNVSWDDAGEFCRRLSKIAGKAVRLPSDGEWEYACRAGTKTDFFFGADPNHRQLAGYAWYQDDSADKVHPVGLKKPNPWGLYDMYGNVVEWCSSGWTDFVPGSGDKDSRTPNLGFYGVLRGGSCIDNPTFCSSARRSQASAVSRSAIVGFRVAISASPAGQALAASEPALQEPAGNPGPPTESPTNVAATQVSASSKPNDHVPPRELALNLGDGVSLKVTLIPAGKFLMGSWVGPTPRPDLAIQDRETPQHPVTLSRPFYIGVYEVTQQQYQTVMGKNPSQFKGPQRPVERVSWNDANEFCRKLSQKTGRRVHLPTEAQWEYACRAGSTTRFYYGDDYDYHELPKHEWCALNSERQTHPVGQKTPNAWGLYDMSGNVMEWCFDRYQDSFKTAQSVDPAGPGYGSYGVVRGGSAFSAPAACRSAFRGGAPIVRPVAGCGFRIAVDAG